MPGSNPIARWTARRATIMSYVVPPLIVPIILAIALAAFSYALN